MPLAHLMPFAIMSPSWEVTTDKILMIMSRIQSTKFPSDLDYVMAMNVAIDMAQTVQVMWTRDQKWLALQAKVDVNNAKKDRTWPAGATRCTIKMHNQAVRRAPRIKVALRAKVDVKRCKQIIGMPRN